MANFAGDGPARATRRSGNPPFFAVARRPAPTAVSIRPADIDQARRWIPGS